MSEQDDSTQNPSEIKDAPAQFDLNTYKEMSVGEILRKTREHYGQSIGQVEVNLRIRASHLEALESGEAEKLPGRVYAIGFVRAYSEYLGLDGDKMVSLFKSHSIGEAKRPDLLFPVLNYESQTPNIFIVLICITGIIGLIAYLSITHIPVKYEEVVPPVPKILTQSAITPAAIKTVAEKKPAPINKSIELVVTQDSWVEIKDSKGKKLLSEVLKTGDKYIVDEDKTLTLATGNAGGITIFINGKKVGPLGEKAQVKRNIALTRENLSVKE